MASPSVSRPMWAEFGKGAGRFHGCSPTLQAATGSHGPPETLPVAVGSVLHGGCEPLSRVHWGLQTPQLACNPERRHSDLTPKAACLGGCQLGSSHGAEACLTDPVETSPEAGTVHQAPFGASPVLPYA